VSTAGAKIHLTRAERALRVAAREVAAARGELDPPQAPKEALQQLGAWIRAYREAQGLSRAALARKAGISISSLKNYERSRNWPALSTVTALGRLGLPPELQALLRDPQ